MDKETVLVISWASKRIISGSARECDKIRIEAAFKTLEKQKLIRKLTIPMIALLYKVRMRLSMKYRAKYLYFSWTVAIGKSVGLNSSLPVPRAGGRPSGKILSLPSESFSTGLLAAVLSGVGDGDVVISF